MLALCKHAERDARDLRRAATCRGANEVQETIDRTEDGGASTTRTLQWPHRGGSTTGRDRLRVATEVPHAAGASAHKEP
jgi:hypothetical protein